ncbi:hypothetical protein EH223_06035 [candidate division KSB1 bacterium]|nr:hypothetical protein [candidate division KSB1 bacterium]RQW04998.1 MAG: hypothetical protein EH223_06035 [candidate division KSB1 bacterium]
MKAKLLLMTFVLLSLIISECVIGAPKVPQNVDWQAFSENLAKAIKSDNKGLQQSAMCMIIRYAENLSIPRDAIFEVVRVFRSDGDTNVRLLALVTLHRAEDPWAMDYLKRHRLFEKENRIKKLCCCAVRTYYAKRDSLKADKTEQILAQKTHEVLESYSAQAAGMLNLDEYGF